MRVEDGGGFLLRSELPAYLGISRGRVSQLARQGRLVKPARRTRFGSPLYRRSDVDRWWARIYQGGAR